MTRRPIRRWLPLSLGRPWARQSTLEGAKVVDGKVYADPIMAANYAILVGDLGDAWNAFTDEANKSGLVESLIGNITTDRAFFAVVGMIAANAENGRVPAAPTVINHLTASIGRWAKGSSRALEKDAERRFLGALFGNVIPPGFTPIGG